ncbi:hypothetical protein KKF91_07970 [Myxococcota bacterium]|nr:hypothetical protein [Myxococcota bacterium]MBU1430481.1 hypothetical protein [Myxococcota bacterium]MBU1897520.1 hypothetical protein [Myxococcota bacterium]
MNAKIAEVVGAILQTELAVKLVQNEALIRALMRALSLSSELRAAMDERIAAGLARLNLASGAQIEELHAEIQRLHSELSELRQALDREAR